MSDVLPQVEGIELKLKRDIALLMICLETYMQVKDSYPS